MCTYVCVGRCALVAAAVWAVGLSAALSQAAPSEEHPQARIAAGKKLFLQKWEIKQAAPGESDGLGPVYNAESCVACHRQGGIGGGGPRENDVELITLGGGSPGDQLARLFRGSPTALLHARGTDANYDEFRKGILNPLLPGNPVDLPLAQARSERELHLSTPLLRHPSFQLRLSRRNTPALYGLGLIDAIPAEAIIAEAKRQAEKNKTTAGRIASSNAESDDPFAVGKTRTVRVGRFGWRGQIGSLQEFVVSACSNELGLEAPAHSQPIDPLSPVAAPPVRTPAKPPLPPANLDITAAECRQLTAYVAELPRPRMLLPANPRGSPVIQGEFLFERTGCSACHRQDLGGVSRLYSDLLLHDMGPDLADPVPANPAVAPGTVVSAASSYYGGSVQIASANQKLQREWRTPPLWGVRDSAPYLHDGRAATLHQAIAEHGGQGEPARTRFLHLSEEEQDRLVTFLHSLTAPNDADPLPAN